MASAFSSMEYPHWLIVAGAVLLMLGFVGLALHRKVVEAGLDDLASDRETPELAETPGADREPKLDEQKRDRWADQQAEK